MEPYPLDIDRNAPLDVQRVGRREDPAFVLDELTFAATPAQRRVATLIRPTGEGPFPAILYVHWYEPQACDSNRTQFHDEAQAMAGRGVMSLLIETMWSDREWFLKRSQDGDYAGTVQQAAEIRRAMDLLLSQPCVDASRFAFVGHDFGAMAGVVAGSDDARPTCYVLMAGTPRYPDWYLYYPRLEGVARSAFVEQMKPLDPIERVSQLAPAPLLLQFGKDDPHVPLERAQAFHEAASKPKDVRFYDAGHGLNDKAREERMAWLADHLML